MIQAIPTTYAGVEFRSRLEADYAATFDSIKLGWQYEPEGFKLSDGTWYSPDFYLPAARAWVEVKGDHHERESKVEQFATDLWEDAEQPHYEDPRAPLVILGPLTLTRDDKYDVPRLRQLDLGLKLVGVRYPADIKFLGPKPKTKPVTEGR